MRLAYIISAYKLPAMLVRLVRRLDSPDASFFIHVDARTPDATYREMCEPLANRGNVRFLPRHECHWGDSGHVRATLVGLQALIAAGESFDYVVLLTGQDYPIKSNAQIAATLAAGEGRVFMRAFPLPNERWTGGGMDRIEHWHFNVGDRRVAFPGTPFGNALLDAGWSLPARLLGLRRTFPAGLRPYGGGSYWCIPADCARYVHDFVGANRGFVDFFRYVDIPDEIFFQTVVMNSPFAERVSGDDLRFIDWGRGGDSPAVLTLRDLDALRASPALFARKFDPGVDALVLDRLDSLPGR